MKQISFLKAPPASEHDYPTFAGIREAFGFIPNFFRAQTDRKDLIDAQVAFVGAAMVQPGELSRRLREYVFLAVSARNLSTYCVTAHCEIVRMLAIAGPEPEQIAIDHTQSRISIAEKALLNFVVKLNGKPQEIRRQDINALRTFGFSDRQILEAAMMAGVARYANLVSFALGATPDFANDRVDFHRPAAASAR
jgi:uncharacterized peroxidase-related enzyme